MAFVATATLVGGGSALLGGAIIGAGIGGAYSAITGDGDILNSMLTGGLIGGAGAGLLGAAGAGGGAFTGATETGLATLPGEGVAAAGGSKFGMLGKGLAATTALSLLGSKGGSSAGQPSTPGMIRPYTYAANPADQTNQAIYPSAPNYDLAGNPVMDTSERRYFDQKFTAGEPFKAAQGGLMAAYQTGGPVERMSMMNTAMSPQGGMYPQGMIDKTQYAVPTQRPNSMEVLDSGAQTMFAPGGSVEDEEDERRRKKISMTFLEEMAGGVRPSFEYSRLDPTRNQIDELKMSNPNFAESMSPSIMGMTDGAQYGSQMMKSFGGQPSSANFMPNTVDPKSGSFGGIASIGRDLDPETRIAATANLYRTKRDKTPLNAIRRVGLGISRNIGKDADLSAFYEQDPSGRDKMGGVRYSKRFQAGGMSQDYNLGDYSDGGRLLRGPGDGVSDDIPAVIGKRQPARLADGEFVIPARIVSELGNGSTDAGAKRLYAMMDKIQSGRKKTVGKGNIAVDAKAKKHLLA